MSNNIEELKKNKYKENIINKQKNIDDILIIVNEYKNKLNSEYNIDIKNNLQIEIKKLNRIIGSKKCSITNSLKTIRKTIGNQISNIDHNVLLLIINYINTDISLSNLLLTNKAFNNIIINEYDYYILIFKTSYLTTFVHIPKHIFINNNITLEQIFYIPFGKYKCTILHYCAIYNNIDLLLSIFYLFPNLNINCSTTPMMWCPIHFALHYGFSDISILLFNIGIDYNYTTLNNKPRTIQTLLNKKSHMAINFNLNTLFNNSIQQFTKKTEFNYNILINDTYFMDNIMARIFNLILSTNSLKLKIIGLNI